MFLWGLLHTGVESHLSGVALIMLAVIAAAGLAAGVTLGWSRAGIETDPRTSAAAQGSAGGGDEPGAASEFRNTSIRAC